MSASKIVMVGFSAAIVVTSVGDIEPNHQHQSGKTITSLAASSATVAPISAFIVYDPEHHRLDQLPTPYSTPLTS
jgi:hypothetical protein